MAAETQTTEEPTIKRAPVGGPVKPGWRSMLIGLVIAAAAIALIVWCFAGVQFDFTHFRTGIAAGIDYVRQMFPRSRADFREIRAYFPTILDPLRETIQMAIAGTVLGAVPALPLSFFAARTTSLFRPISVVVKTFLNISRSVPILVYALIIVSAIGLGAPAGVLAIAFGSFVMLCKLYAEALESVAPGPVEAVKATGGNAAQVFVFAMLPQVFPGYLSATLYSLELNLQASFILGLVGAGGIGFELQNALRLYQLLHVGVMVFILIVLVNLVDYLSFRVRQVFS